MIFLQGQELTRDITLPKIIETRRGKHSAFQQQKETRMSHYCQQIQRTHHGNILKYV